MKNSNIEWTDHTWNPWIGCTKVSAGCAHCYAEARDKRYDGGVHWGKGAPRRRTAVANWMEPFKWDRAARAVLELCRDLETPRPRVFSASLADWMDDEIPLEWLGDMMDVVRMTLHLDWLLLTKRPENIRPRLSALLDLKNYSGPTAWDRTAARRRWLADWMANGVAPLNVWIGTTVEDQAAADTRIPAILEIPAPFHFLSCEPLLGPVDLRPLPPGAKDRQPVSWLNLGCTDERIDWIIAGGESGPGARPMEADWARSLRDQCVDGGAAFFMKQMGGASDKRGELSDIPEDLRIRQFP